MAPFVARPNAQVTRRDVKLNAGGMFGNGRNLDKSIYVKPGPKYAERWGRNSKVIKENKGLFGMRIQEDMSEATLKETEGSQFDVTKVAPVFAAVIAGFVAYNVPH